MDFVLSYHNGIQDKTPIFLALKVSLRVVREDIKKRRHTVSAVQTDLGQKNGILKKPWATPRLVSFKGLIQHPISFIWKSTGHLGYSLEVKREQRYDIALNVSENSKNKNKAALLRELSCWTILPGTPKINLIYVTFYITNETP